MPVGQAAVGQRRVLAHRGNHDAVAERERTLEEWIEDRWHGVTRMYCLLGTACSEARHADAEERREAAMIVPRESRHKCRTHRLLGRGLARAPEREADARGAE